MAAALKNRLVGTVILVAIAVIFLPDMLDGKKAESNDVFVTIPAAPSKKTIVDPEPFPIERVASAAKRPVEIVEQRADDDVAQTPSESKVPSNESETLAPPKSPDIQSQSVAELPKDETETAPSEDDLEGIGWVIQLGTFRHEKNVEQLVEKLEEADYKVFTRPIITSSGTLTKVFVGPDLDKKVLDRALTHLNELTQLRGKVTRYSTQS